jgi:hypothetical protein
VRGPISWSEARISDRRWLNRWHTSRPGQVSGVELLEYLTILHTNDAVARLLSLLRRESLVAMDSGTVAIMADLVGSIEGAHTLDSYSSAVFSEWIADDENEVKVRNLDSRCLDELAQILERARLEVR